MDVAIPGARCHEPSAVATISASSAGAQCHFDTRAPRLLTPVASSAPHLFAVPTARSRLSRAALPPSARTASIDP